MKRFCLGLAGLLLAIPAAAAGGNSDCGGDAYSFAEVVTPGRSARRRPLVSVPDSLCADLASRQDSRMESLSIYLDGRGDEAGPQMRPARSRPFRHLPY